MVFVTTPPLLDEKGNPIVFCNNFQKYLKYHKDLLNVGVKLHTCIVHAGWVGVDTYDYSLTDKTLDSLASLGDNAYILPRVKLNVPVEWCVKYPEDVFVYYEGPRNKKEIAKLVGTLRQDYLGYDAPDGYYQAVEYTDTRPNVNSLIGLQSLSSEQWLKANINLSKYKLVVFAYDFSLDREHIKRLPFAEDATFMFNYCAGIRNKSVSLCNTERLTGVKLCELSTGKYDFPELSIVGEAEKQLLE